MTAAGTKAVERAMNAHGVMLRLKHAFPWAKLAGKVGRDDAELELLVHEFKRFVAVKVAEGDFDAAKCSPSGAIDAEHGTPGRCRCTRSSLQQRPRPCSGRRKQMSAEAEMCSGCRCWAACRSS